jgi:hypothetical protein
MKGKAPMKMEISVAEVIDFNVQEIDFQGPILLTMKGVDRFGELSILVNPLFSLNAK